jgi:hypothetical protein
MVFILGFMKRMSLFGTLNFKQVMRFADEVAIEGAAFLVGPL